MYLIDGNNVIGGRVGWHKDKPGSRRKLLEDLARLKRLKQIKVTVVFDGAPDQAFSDGSRYRGVKVFYARQGSDADARIVELVETERNRKNLSVVTSDGQLTARVRVCGVKVIRSGEFRKLLDSLTDESAGEELPKVKDGEMDKWMRYFGVAEDEDEEA